MTNRDDMNSLICGACQRLANIPAGERLCSPCTELHILQAEVGQDGPDSVIGQLRYNDAMAEAPSLPELDDETLAAMAEELGQ